jgi:type IV secretory pathway VirB2 component (pilin)
VSGELEVHHEEVVAPDQLRPTVSGRLARFGAIVTIIALVLMALIGNHRGGVEKIFLIAIAALILLMLILDFVLRRAGLRN